MQNWSSRRPWNGFASAYKNIGTACECQGAGRYAKSRLERTFLDGHDFYNDCECGNESGEKANA